METKSLRNLTLFILSFIFIVNFLFIENTFALDIVTPDYIMNKRKRITPKLEDKTVRPLRFSKSNNLRRKQGSYFLARGEYLILKISLIDLLDQPISNAVVKIWQADNCGYYSYLDNASEGNCGLDFEGTGTSVTNNLGLSEFKTILPGFYGHRAPHIHTLIQGSNFELETEIFFENHPRNQIDKKLNSLSRGARELLVCDMEEDKENAVKTCKITIKIDYIQD